MPGPFHPIATIDNIQHTTTDWESSAPMSGQLMSSATYNHQLQTNCKPNKIFAQCTQKFQRYNYTLHLYSIFITKHQTSVKIMHPLPAYKKTGNYCRQITPNKLSYQHILTCTSIQLSFSSRRIP